MKSSQPGQVKLPDIPTYYIGLEAQPPRRPCSASSPSVSRPRGLRTAPAFPSLRLLGALPCLPNPNETGRTPSPQVPSPTCRPTSPAPVPAATRPWVYFPRIVVFSRPRAPSLIPASRAPLGPPSASLTPRPPRSPALSRPDASQDPHGGRLLAFPPRTKRPQGSASGRQRSRGCGARGGARCGSWARGGGRAVTGGRRPRLQGNRVTEPEALPAQLHDATEDPSPGLSLVSVARWPFLLASVKPEGGTMSAGESSHWLAARAAPSDWRLKPADASEQLAGLLDAEC